MFWRHFPPAAHTHLHTVIYLWSVFPSLLLSYASLTYVRWEVCVWQPLSPRLHLQPLSKITASPSLLPLSLLHTPNLLPVFVSFSSCYLFIPIRLVFNLFISGFWSSVRLPVSVCMFLLENLYACGWLCEHCRQLCYYAGLKAKEQQAGMEINK